MDILAMAETKRMLIARKLNTISMKIFQESYRFPESVELKESYKKVFGNSIYFPDDQFVLILKLRSYLDDINYSNKSIAELITIACLSCLLPVSFLKKQGDVRFKTDEEKKKGMRTLQELLPAKIEQIAKDVANLSLKINGSHCLICPNAKDIGKFNLKDKIDAVITSPPYLNGTNYFRNTKLELWF